MDVRTSDGGPKIWRCSRTTVTFPAEESPTGASPTTRNPHNPQMHGCITQLPEIYRPKMFPPANKNKKRSDENILFRPVPGGEVCTESEGREFEVPHRSADPGQHLHSFYRIIEPARTASGLACIQYPSGSFDISGLRSPYSILHNRHPSSVSDKYLNRPTSITAPEQPPHRWPRSSTQPLRL